MGTGRLEHLKRFYSLLERLEDRIGGPRLLAESRGRLNWPQRGVYFFMEGGEQRSDSGTGPRIVRVGTHALTAHSRTSLWNRLSQHRGTLRSGGGNHRGSVFRRLIGTALIARDGLEYPTWDDRKATASAEIRLAERPMEQAVSETIGAMRFVWLAVNDGPGDKSARGYIERNAIALLSNSSKTPIDPPSSGWLKFQEILVVDALNGLANRTNFLERQERQPYVLNHIKRIANFDNNPPVYTAFGFSPRGSNVSRDDVESVLKALDVESPWKKLNDITNDIGISRLSLKDDFRTFGCRRNKAAHDSKFNIPYVDLLELLEGTAAIGIAFDVLATSVVEAYLKAKSEKDRRARLKKVSFQYRFIDERSDGHWIEKSFPSMSPIKKYPSESAAVAGVRARKPRRYNIVRNISGIPVQLF